MDNLPSSVAGGRQPDLEVFYCGEYVVLIEVTLFTGERQYYMEAEPVTRHVAPFQAKEVARVRRKVYCVFIALIFTLHNDAFSLGLPPFLVPLIMREFLLFPLMGRSLPCFFTVLPRKLGWSQVTN